MPETENDSILNSVKDGLGGIVPEATYFDNQIIIHINTVFQRFYQLGIGPKVPFKIAGSDETWTQFFSAPGWSWEDRDGIDSTIDMTATMEMCKSDMVLRVKLLFDPPSSSYGIDLIKEQIKEYEWVMNTQAEIPESYL